MLPHPRELRQLSATGADGAGYDSLLWVCSFCADAPPRRQRCLTQGLEGLLGEPAPEEVPARRAGSDAAPPMGRTHAAGEQIARAATECALSFKVAPRTRLRQRTLGPSTSTWPWCCGISHAGLTPAQCLRRQCTAGLIWNCAAAWVQYPPYGRGRGMGRASSAASSGVIRARHGFHQSATLGASFIFSKGISKILRELSAVVLESYWRLPISAHTLHPLLLASSGPLFSCRDVSLQRIRIRPGANLWKRGAAARAAPPALCTVRATWRRRLLAAAPPCGTRPSLPAPPTRALSATKLDLCLWSLYGQAIVLGKSRY